MKKLLCLLTALFVITSAVLSGCSEKQPVEIKLTPADILSKSYDSMQAATSFHFVLDHADGGTPISKGIEMQKAEGDLVSPDKLQITITGTVAGMSIEVQVVTAEEQTMMTNPLSGVWEAVPESFKVLSVLDPGTGIAAIIKGLTNATDLGDEALGAIQCYHLKGDVLSEALAPLTGITAVGATISTEVWIDKETFLVQQVKLTGKITDDEVEGIVRTLTFSDYNKDIDITLPQ